MRTITNCLRRGFFLSSYKNFPVLRMLFGLYFFSIPLSSLANHRYLANADFTITGKVTDSTGNPVQGVSVKIEGSEKGTFTNNAGLFKLLHVPANAVIVFSHVNFKEETVPLNGNTNLVVSLKNNSTSLADVVVVGYGTQKKATATGAISMVKGEVLQQSPAVNFTNTLAGRLPGLVAINASGEPGNDNATIRIRGANTLGDNAALIVVDGIVGRDMASIRPEDVESVTVLKDASSAIYGARAANGVILITTKRGKTGKPEITANVNYGISSPTVIPEMADAATYAAMMNEIETYAGRAPIYTDEEIEKFRDGSEPWLYPNTNWFDAVFKKTTPQTRSDLSIRGGTETIRYFVSGGYSLQDAIYKNSSARFSQANFRANLDANISTYISIGIDLSGSQEDRDFAANPFGYMLNRSKPMFIATYPGNKPAAGYQAGQSPVVLVSDDLGYDRRKSYNFLSNARLKIDIPWVSGLSITTNLSYDKTINNGKFWRKPYMLYSWDRQTFDANGAPVVTGALDGPYATAELNQNFSDGYRTTLNALLNYNKVFGNHQVKFLAGVEKITGGSMDLTAFRRGFVSTAVDQMFAGGDPDKNNGGSANVNARLNYFGRINYDFKQKYLLEFVWRYDGSYIFPDAKRFGFFPGASVGWILSEESFWSGIANMVNRFKITGSWGQTGNDRIEAYQYLSSYSFANQPFIFNETLLTKALNELRIANPNITWEVANQTNVGLEAQFLKGAVQLSANYFYNLRSNILAFRNASVPATSGLTLPRENIGRVANRGFEVELAYRGSSGNFNYSVSANAALSKNKILFWDETPGVPEYQQSTGRPMNAGLYYLSMGVFKTQEDIDKHPHWANAKPGDLIFKDVNEDGAINGLDLVRYGKTDLPTFTGGFTVDLSYKNIFLSALFQGAAGAVRSYSLESGLIGNFLADDAYGRWTPDNTNADKPRAWNTGGYYWTNAISGGTWGINNTYWLKNNDYLRLKTLQLGYNLPSQWLNKIGANNATVYFTGLNLLTFAGFKSFDPETVGTVYPLSKVYNFGIKLTL